MMIDKDPGINEAARKALADYFDPMGSPFKRFKALALSILECGQPISLGGRFFLWRFARQYPSLIGAINPRERGHVND